MGRPGQHIDPVVFIALPGADGALITSFEHDEPPALKDAIMGIWPLVGQYQSVATAWWTADLVEARRQHTVVKRGGGGRIDSHKSTRFTGLKPVSVVGVPGGAVRVVWPPLRRSAERLIQNDLRGRSDRAAWPG